MNKRKKSKNQNVLCHHEEIPETTCDGESMGFERYQQGRKKKRTLSS